VRVVELQSTSTQRLDAIEAAQRTLSEAQAKTDSRLWKVGLLVAGMGGAGGFGASELAKLLGG